MRPFNVLLSVAALIALFLAAAPPAATGQVIVPPPAGDPTPLVDRVPLVDPVPPADRIPPVDRPNQIAVRDLALRLGMDLRATADERVMVAAVHPDSQAAALGIQKGDVLTSIERQPITAETTVVNIIAADNPEKKISLIFLRDGKSVPVTTAFPDRVERVAPRPSPDAPRAAGVSLFGLTAGVDPQGRVMVVGVVPDSAAALAGAMAGDILVQVDGVGITSLPQFAATTAALVRAKAPGDKLTIDAIRKGSDETYVLILRDRDFQAVAPPPDVAAAPEIIAAAGAQPMPPDAPPAAPDAPSAAPDAPRRPAEAAPARPDVREAEAPRAAPAADDDNPERRVIFCMEIRRLASGSLVVTDVKEGSPADVAGIRPGDALVSVAGEKLDSLDEMADLIGRQREGDTVQFGVVRADKLGTLQVKMLPCEYREAEEKLEPVAAGGLEAEVRSLRQRVSELEEMLESLSASVEELQRR